MYARNLFHGRSGWITSISWSSQLITHTTVFLVPMGRFGVVFKSETWNCGIYMPFIYPNQMSNLYKISLDVAFSARRPTTKIYWKFSRTVLGANNIFHHRYYSSSDWPDGPTRNAIIISEKFCCILTGICIVTFDRHNRITFIIIILWQWCFDVTPSIPVNRWDSNHPHVWPAY